MNNRFLHNNHTVDGENFSITEMNTDILKEISKILQCVDSTFGPAGRPVLFSGQFGESKLTQDGAHIVDQLESEDPSVNAILNIIKNSILKIASTVGDGTTTATIMTRLLIDKLSGFFQTKQLKEIIRGILICVEEAKKIISTELTTKLDAQNPETKNIIANIARVSSKSEKIGELVADAFEKIGTQGLVEVVKGNSVEITLEVREGISFARGYHSTGFVDKSKSSLEFNDCFVFIYKKTLAMIPETFVFILEKITAQNKPLLIIAEDFSDSISMIFASLNRTNLKNVCVRSPEFGEHKDRILEDISILTGAKIVDDLTLQLKDFCLENLGEANFVRVSSKQTIIAGGKGDAQKIEEQKNHLRNHIKDCSSGYELDFAKKRLGMMEGGICSIRVGGFSETDQNAIFDLTEDAVAAAKAALSGGVVSGGLVSLLRLFSRIREETLDKKTISESERIGINFFCGLGNDLGEVLLNNVYVQHTKSMAPQVILSEIQHQHENNKKDFGYDAAKMQFVNSVSAEGIIEPALVLETVLETSAQLIKQIFSIARIINKPEKKDDHNKYM